MISRDELGQRPASRNDVARLSFVQPFDKQNFVGAPTDHLVDRRENKMRLPFISLLIVGSAGWIMNPAWAQDRVVPIPPNLAYPAGSEITFQWVYSCRNITALCTFSCPGLLAPHRVTALQIYLGTIPIGNNQNNPALFYFYSTESIPRGNGFHISSGTHGTLSCNVSGMTLEYSGAPK
jgi:hypothetical protein